MRQKLEAELRSKHMPMQVNVFADCKPAELRVRRVYKFGGRRESREGGRHMKVLGLRAFLSEMIR